MTKELKDKFNSSKAEMKKTYDKEIYSKGMLVYALCKAAMRR